LRRFCAGNLIGFYSTEIYIPVSVIAAFLRGVSRRIRKKSDTHTQATSLPVKSDGNVRISELGVICRFARGLSEGGTIFEIGTFDGRTTLNLALNSTACRVATLDLPPRAITRFAVESGERHYIEKTASGERFLKNSRMFPDAVNRIVQLYGDSAEFDFKPYEGECDLVFVDGSHAYEYALKDSHTAFRLRKNGGVIIWHDYGVWKGVTRALEELEENTGAGLYHIYGTSLVVCM